VIATLAGGAGEFAIKCGAAAARALKPNASETQRFSGGHAMESGAKWASFIIGVVLLVTAAVLGVKDWWAGGPIGWTIVITLTVLGTLATFVGLSRAPLDPRAAREARVRAAAGDDAGGD
jgi:RsiW-degrading membrane proteinase PrsW (M82 family)